MSENISHPFEQNDSFAPDDPFAPGAIDDTLAAYQTPASSDDNTARLISALVAAHELPAEAQDALERVRQRVLRRAEVAAVSSAGIAIARREKKRSDARPPFTHTPLRAIRSTRAWNRFGISLDSVAVVLIFALLVGGFVALFRFQGQPGTGGDGGSGQYTAFSLPATARQAPFITAGPDGNIWFYAPRTALFGRVSMSGQVKTLAPFGPGAALSDVITGSDGYLWIADQGSNAIWRFDPRTSATRQYPFTPAMGQIQGVAMGRDGSIWATTSNGSSSITDPLIRMDPRTGTVKKAYAVPGLTSLSYGLGPIIAAPDGSIWFAPNGTTEWIGRIDPHTGAIKTFDIPHEGYTASPQSLTVGPDGNIWFACNPSATSGDVVGRVTPGGQVTSYNLTIEPEVISAGPDGNLWFSTADGALARITPGGVVTEYPNIPATGGVILGPDGRLWATYSIPSANDNWPSYIVRVDRLPQRRRLGGPL